MKPRIKHFTNVGNLKYLKNNLICHKHIKKAINTSIKSYTSSVFYQGVDKNTFYTNHQRLSTGEPRFCGYTK